MTNDETRRAAESAARHSYGRLLALLASRTRDVAAAEDALADAFHAALRTWPVRGVPASPEAWLLTAARRTLVSGHRRQRVREEAVPVLAHLQALTAAPDAETFPDERLKLLFVCAHPAIDRAIRAPLMLQAVLGLDAARLASAFLVAPATMSQRLVRAKAKIGRAGIPFRVPEPADLPERLGDVLDAIYAAFGIAWHAVVHGADRWTDLSDEALWLARVVVELLPGEPEAHGLLALLLHSDARRRARRDGSGRFVPLSEQDVSRWDHPRMDEADRHLTMAAAMGRPGPWQLEAAIQAAHASRRCTGVVPWDGIATLYEGLVRVAPTLGARVGRAAAVGAARGPRAGLALLDALAPDEVKDYQPYWALRAHLLADDGRIGDARQAYRHAAGLASEPAVRNFLLEREARLVDPS